MFTAANALNQPQVMSVGIDLPTRKEFKPTCQCSSHLRRKSFQVALRRNDENHAIVVFLRISKSGLPEQKESIISGA